MFKFKFAVLIMFLLPACTSEDNSREALEGLGFTDIQFKGYALYGCSEDDTFKTKFRAKNTKGQITEGVVCCGLMKNCTVRF